jgi:hypothetical protein
LTTKGQSRYGRVPRVKRYNSAAQSAPTAATWTQLAFNQSIFNYGGWTFTTDGGGNTVGLVCPVKGLYRLLGMSATVANSQSFILALTLNNAGAGTGHTWADGTCVEGYTGATDSNGVSFPTYCIEQVAELSKGDVLGMEWYQSVGPQPGVIGRTAIFAELLPLDYS